MVTPFDADLRVDEEASVRLMHHLVEHGSDGLVIAGTTGEAPTLTDKEQLDLIELAVREVGEKATVVAGTGSNDTRHACYLTEQATQLGVDATLSVTPYYNRPSRAGIKRHFEEVSRATDKPIILYNIPARTGTDMPNDLLAELAQLEHVDAVKQARATDVAIVDGLALYAGDDDMLCQVLNLGGAGGITVASHLVGAEMHRMVDEPAARDQINVSLQDVFAMLGLTTNPTPIKAALDMLGFEVGGLRLPLVEASSDERNQIRSVLERHNLLTPAAS